MKIEKQSRFTVKQKRIISIIIILLLICFTGAVAFFIGKPLVKFVGSPELFRNFVESRGILGKIAFIGMVIFQVVIAVVPGEPFEIGAGYAFGIFEGTLLCLIGILVGSMLVFGLVRSLGVRIVEVFFSIDKIRSLKFIENSKKLNLISFIVFLIPGTPKDLLSYFVGLTEMKFSSWIFICTVARIPSVITSVISGNALGIKNYKLACIFFGVTALISIIGIIIYKKMSREDK